MLAAPSKFQPSRRWFALLCLAIVLGALALRLHGLGDRMLNHPENFAPGLPMPEWVKFPPPSHDVESVLRGNLIDGHPPAYFLGLLAWTKVFGASLTSLRMPSALLGALSVGLLALIALREGNRWTALLAAALLALHGHHLYWSQLARMYVPTAFLALLSTWFLLRLRERGRGLDLWGLFATTTLALWMQLYAWPLVFAQILGGLVLAARERRAPIGLRAQLMAVIASIPVVQLSIYQNPPTRWYGQAREYLEFGFLFHSKVPFLDVQPDLAWRGPWLIAAGVLVLLLAACVRREPEVVSKASSAPAIPAWFGGSLAAIVTLAMVGFVLFAPARQRVGTAVLWAAAALPLLLAAAAPPLERWLSRCTSAPGPRLARFAALDIPLSWFLALVPFSLMLLVSLERGAFVARGTIVFLPFLVLAVAHTVVAATRFKWLWPAALASVIAIHAASTLYFQRADSARRDYRGLAQLLTSKLRPTDRILVENDFTTPPLIYYLAECRDQLVHRDHARIVAASPEVERVWIPSLDKNKLSAGLLEAVSGFEPAETIEALGIEATLYERR